MTNKTNLIIPVGVHFKINNPRFIMIILEAKVGHFAHGVFQFVRVSSTTATATVLLPLNERGKD